MADNFTRTGLPEINPYPLIVPASVRALDPELHEYLLRLNRILLDQHNKSQAGDTTLDWQVLLGLDDLSRYTLGSLGSFSHPTYGLLRARYVRFRTTLTSPAARVAGFAKGTAGLEWEVVNDAEKAQDNRPVGLIASETMPQIGQFGWVVTEGVNLHTLVYERKPQTGKLIPWGKGTLGQLLGSAEKVGSFWQVNPGSMRVRLEAGSGGGAGGFGPSAISDAELEYGKQILEFENRLEFVAEQSKLFISILGRRVSELSEDSASLQLFEQLQAGANWANLANTAANNAAKYGRISEISALATQSYLREAKVYRDEAGFYSQSSIEFRNEASVNAAEASVASGQAVEASLTAQGYSTQALEYVSLAASLGENLVKNGTFSDPSWQSNQQYPPKWDQWATPLVQAQTRYSPGLYGPYAAHIIKGPGEREIGITQRVNAPAGKYIVGVDIEYYGGVLGAAGVYYAFYNANGIALGDGSIKFTRDDLLTGGLNIPYGKQALYSWAKPIEAPEGTAWIQLYLMNDWSGLGPADPDVCDIVWHRAYIKRPAYSDSAGATAYVDAQITEVKKVIASETEARGQLSTSVDTRFTNVGNTLNDFNTTIGSYNQRIDSAANAAGSAVSAVESLKTTVNDNSSSITQISQSLNGITSSWGIELNTNGRITGLKVVGTAQRTDFIIVVDRFKMETPNGQVTPFEVSGTQFRIGVDLYAGNHRVIFDNGTVMLVLGTGFGQNNQFIEWYGPTMPIENCTPGLAISYKTVGGSAYFGGSLNAGIITNSKASSAQGDTQIVVGPFTSAGKSVNGIGSNRINAVVGSNQAGQWRTDIDPQGPDPFAGSQYQITGQWVLEYSTNGSTWTQLGATLSLTTTTFSQVFTYQRFENGEPTRYSYWRQHYSFDASATGTVTFGGISTAYFRFRRIALSTSQVDSNIISVISVEQ